MTQTDEALVGKHAGKRPLGAVSLLSLL